MTRPCQIARRIIGPITRERSGSEPTSTRAPVFAPRVVVALRVRWMARLLSRQTCHGTIPLWRGARSPAGTGASRRLRSTTRSRTRATPTSESDMISSGNWVFRYRAQHRPASTSTENCGACIFTWTPSTGASFHDISTPTTACSMKPATAATSARKAASRKNSPLMPATPLVKATSRPYFR